jgi:glutamate-5-semialdehyde dehydrogenase
MSKLKESAIKAREAANALALLSDEEKNAALHAIAKGLREDCDIILKANGKDVENSKRKKIPAALLDRLTLNKMRVDAAAHGAEEIALLPDPVGVEEESWERPNGLKISRVSVPLGVLGIIYEARPNVTVDCCALAIKTGNGVILRGSSSALISNKAIVASIKKALSVTAVSPEILQLVEDVSEAVATEMMSLNGYIDVLIPRGGAGLIESVLKNASVPVLETGVGNCHIYVDASAEPEMAEKIIVNSKTQRPGVCNACETILIHKDWALMCLPDMLEAIKEKRVELRVCEKTLDLCREYLPEQTFKKATEKDWASEYLDLILAVKIVDDLDEAIAHIKKYGTGHTEAIISEDYNNAEKFLKRVDAAVVNHNASTRFTDGYEFGFGAEIGISTQKMHARGPVGPRQLTSYKYVVRGDGQLRLP